MALRPHRLEFKPHKFEFIFAMVLAMGGDHPSDHDVGGPLES
jgi:hypothetical protein